MKFLNTNFFYEKIYMTDYGKDVDNNYKNYTPYDLYLINNILNYHLKRYSLKDRPREEKIMSRVSFDDRGNKVHVVVSLIDTNFKTIDIKKEDYDHLQKIIYGVSNNYLILFDIPESNSNTPNILNNYKYNYLPLLKFDDSVEEFSGNKYNNYPTYIENNKIYIDLKNEENYNDLFDYLQSYVSDELDKYYKSGVIMETPIIDGLVFDDKIGKYKIVFPEDVGSFDGVMLYEQMKYYNYVKIFIGFNDNTIYNILQTGVPFIFSDGFLILKTDKYKNINELFKDLKEINFSRYVSQGQRTNLTFDKKYYKNSYKKRNVMNDSNEMDERNERGEMNERNDSESDTESESELIKNSMILYKSDDDKYLYHTLDQYRPDVELLPNRDINLIKDDSLVPLNFSFKHLKKQLNEKFILDLLSKYVILNGSILIKEENIKTNLNINKSCLNELIRVFSQTLNTEYNYLSMNPLSFYLIETDTIIYKTKIIENILFYYDDENKYRDHNFEINFNNDIKNLESLGYFYLNIDSYTSFYFLQEFCNMWDIKVIKYDDNLGYVYLQSDYFDKEWVENSVISIKMNSLPLIKYSNSSVIDPSNLINRWNDLLKINDTLKSYKLLDSTVNLSSKLEYDYLLLNKPDILYSIKYNNFVSKLKIKELDNSYYVEIYKDTTSDEVMELGEYKKIKNFDKLIYDLWNTKFYLSDWAKSYFLYNNQISIFFLNI